jgi:hypothetical protein
MAAACTVEQMQAEFLQRGPVCAAHFESTLQACTNTIWEPPPREDCPVALYEFGNPADLTRATIGPPLVAHTDAGPVVVEDIHSVPGFSPDDTAARVPTEIFFELEHGLEAHDEGPLVHNYTLMLDYRIEDSVGGMIVDFGTTEGCAVRLDVESIRINNGLYWSPGTLPTNRWSTDGQWLRFVLAVQQSPSGTNGTLYVNGTAIAHLEPTESRRSWSGAGLGATIAMGPSLFLFTANTTDFGGRTLLIDTSTVALFDRTLTAGEVTTLGLNGSGCVPDFGRDPPENQAAPWIWMVPFACFCVILALDAAFRFAKRCRRSASAVDSSEKYKKGDKRNRRRSSNVFGVIDLESKKLSFLQLLWRGRICFPDEKVEMHYFSLRFADEALEAAYQDNFVRTTRNGAYSVCYGLFVLYVVAFVLSWEIFTNVMFGVNIYEYKSSMMWYVGCLILLVTARLLRHDAAKAYYQCLLAFYSIWFCAMTCLFNLFTGAPQFLWMSLNQIVVILIITTGAPLFRLQWRISFYTSLVIAIGWNIIFFGFVENSNIDGNWPTIATVFIEVLVWGLAVPVCFWSNRHTNLIARRDFVIVQTKDKAINELEDKIEDLESKAPNLNKGKAIGGRELGSQFASLALKLRRKLLFEAIEEVVTSAYEFFDLALDWYSFFDFANATTQYGLYPWYVLTMITSNVVSLLNVHTRFHTLVTIYEQYTAGIKLFGGAGSGGQELLQSEDPAVRLEAVQRKIKRGIILVSVALAEDAPMLALNTARVLMGLQEERLPDAIVLLSMLVNAMTIGWKGGRVKELWRLHIEEQALRKKVARVLERLGGGGHN